MNNGNILNNAKLLSEELKALNVPVMNGKADEFSSYTFWQYTSVDSIGKILTGNCFWINNIQGMNDLRETALHDADKADVFVQCFCNSDTEKIPMWYLYGGIVGRGASIGLTSAVMKSYINSIKYVWELRWEDEKGYVPAEKLLLGKDIELRIGWVFYADDKLADDSNANPNRAIRVNYRNKFITVENAEDFYKDNYFVKDYPWEYEKEFRLVFINKTGRKIQKIQVDIPEDFHTRKDRKLKIRLAPELPNEDYQKSREDILKKGVRFPNINIEKSRLKVRMDLLSRNRNDINERLRKNPEFLSEEVQEVIYIYRKKLRCDSVE